MGANRKLGELSLELKQPSRLTGIGVQIVLERWPL